MKKKYVSIILILCFTLLVGGCGGGSSKGGIEESKYANPKENELVDAFYDIEMALVIGKTIKFRGVVEKGTINKGDKLIILQQGEEIGEIVVESIIDNNSNEVESATVGERIAINSKISGDIKPTNNDFLVKPKN